MARPITFRVCSLQIYVAGGFNGQEVMRSVEVYNPDYNRWDFVDCMTTPRSGVSLIAHDRYIYALGGFDGINRLYSGELSDSLIVLIADRFEL
jgi:kelch-like protein 10